MGYIKKSCYGNKYIHNVQQQENSEFEAVPFQIIETIITFFDINSEFFAEIRNRNNYLLSYNKKHQSIRFNDLSANCIDTSCGIVIYDDGGIYYHAGQLYTHKSVPPQAYTKYKHQNSRNNSSSSIKMRNGRGQSKNKGYRSLFMKRYLPGTQVSILRRLIHQHCANKAPYEDERLCGNKWHSCGRGYQLVQALYCKVNGKIGKYDAYCDENKYSELWNFLNDIYDKIAGHHCAGHGDEDKLITPISVPIPILSNPQQLSHNIGHHRRHSHKHRNNHRKNARKYHYKQGRIGNHRRRFHHFSNNPDQEATDGHGMDLMMFCEIGTDQVTFQPLPPPVTVGIANNNNQYHYGGNYNPYNSRQGTQGGFSIGPGLQAGHAMLTNNQQSSGGGQNGVVFNSGNGYVMYPMSVPTMPSIPMTPNIMPSVPMTSTMMSYNNVSVNMMSIPNLNKQYD